VHNVHDQLQSLLPKNHGGDNAGASSANNSEGDADNSDGDAD